MSANVETMFSGNREVPWHKLGTVVDGLLTATEAIEAAELNWEVELQPIYAMTREGMTEVENKFATVRDTDSSVLGIVGNVYRPVQNRDLFGFLDSLIDSGEAKYETAGSLNEGKTVWMLLSLGDEIRLNGGDLQRPFMLATSSHDGTSAVRVKPVMTRVVCANTLAWALRETTNSFTARHTTSFSSRVQEAKAALGVTYRYVDAFEQEANQLIDQALTDQQFDSLIKQLVPIVEEPGRKQTIAETTRARIWGAYNSEMIGDYKGTAWGAIQAFSDYDLWLRPVRGKTGLAERQAKQAVAGVSGLTDKARELLLTK